MTEEKWEEESEEEAAEREQYMEENFGDELFHEELSEQDILEMMTGTECPDCEGEIDQYADDSADEIVLCSSCSKEFKFCGTCAGYFPAIHYLCPNDH